MFRKDQFGIVFNTIFSIMFAIFLPLYIDGSNMFREAGAILSFDPNLRFPLWQGKIFLEFV